MVNYVVYVYTHIQYYNTLYYFYVVVYDVFITI